MKIVLLAVIFFVGVSLTFLGLIFFCTRTAKSKKWFELEDLVHTLGDTPEPEKKPDSNRIYL